MVAKFLLLQLVFFDRDFVKLAQNDFTVAIATPQIILLAFLISTEKSGVSLKVIL